MAGILYADVKLSQWFVSPQRMRARDQLVDV
jgi:hypothetical protein